MAATREGNGQDDTSLLGKLLRIDVDGAAAVRRARSTTPTVGSARTPDRRSVATGLRNPWRFSVDPATGDLFIGDVGQGAGRRSNVLRRGPGRA